MAAKETGKFSVEAIEFLFAETGEVSSSGQATEPVLVGIDSATVRCKTCTEVWTARRAGAGAVRQTMGYVWLSCPACGAEEAVRIAALR